VSDQSRLTRPSFGGRRRPSRGDGSTCWLRSSHKTANPFCSKTGGGQLTALDSVLCRKRTCRLPAVVSRISCACNQVFNRGRQPYYSSRLRADTERLKCRRLTEAAEKRSGISEAPKTSSNHPGEALNTDRLGHAPLGSVRTRLWYVFRRFGTVAPVIHHHLISKPSISLSGRSTVLTGLTLRVGFSGYKTTLTQAVVSLVGRPPQLRTANWLALQCTKSKNISASAYHHRTSLLALPSLPRNSSRVSLGFISPIEGSRCPLLLSSPKAPQPARPYPRNHYRTPVHHRQADKMDLQLACNVPRCGTL